MSWVRGSIGQSSRGQCQLLFKTRAKFTARTKRCGLALLCDSARGLVHPFFSCSPAAFGLGKLLLATVGVLPGRAGIA